MAKVGDTWQLAGLESYPEYRERKNDAGDLVTDKRTVTQFSRHAIVYGADSWRFSSEEGTASDGTALEAWKDDLKIQPPIVPGGRKYVCVRDSIDEDLPHLHMVRRQQVWESRGAWTEDYEWPT